MAILVAEATSAAAEEVVVGTNVNGFKIGEAFPPGDELGVRLVALATAVGDLVRVNGYRDRLLSASGRPIGRRTG